CADGGRLISRRRGAAPLSWAQGRPDDQASYYPSEERRSEPEREHRDHDAPTPRSALSLGHRPTASVRGLSPKTSPRTIVAQARCSHDNDEPGTTTRRWEE